MTKQAEKVREVLSWLERRGSVRRREEMKARYGITAPRAFGVPVGTIQQLAKRLGRDHDLAAALWRTGWYEARMLAAFVDDPRQVTPAQMDRWARDFDSWALCDTICFHLFDRTPHAWRKVEQWSRRRAEFVKRAALALLAGLALHDQRAGDEAFRRALVLIEDAAADERHFVKKGVSWALRVVGRRSVALNAAALALARRLAARSDPAARAVGKEAARELASASVRRRLVSGRLLGRRDGPAR
jgi:3-methyladenine DNA glycosylase AlkD